MNTLPDEPIIQLCANSYTDEEVEASKKKLYRSCDRKERFEFRKYDKKKKENLKDILALFHEKGADAPKCLAEDVNKLPPVSFGSVDVSAILIIIEKQQKELELVKLGVLALADSVGSNEKLLRTIEENICKITFTSSGLENGFTNILNSPYPNLTTLLGRDSDNNDAHVSVLEPMNSAASAANTNFWSTSTSAPVCTPTRTVTADLTTARVPSPPLTPNTLPAADPASAHTLTLAPAAPCAPRFNPFNTTGFVTADAHDSANPSSVSHDVVATQATVPHACTIILDTAAPESVHVHDPSADQVNVISVSAQDPLAYKVSSPSAPAPVFPPEPGAALASAPTASASLSTYAAEFARTTVITSNQTSTTETKVGWNQVNYVNENRRITPPEQ